VTGEAGRLLASGRDGDVFEHGPGLVLRKTRDGRSIEHEARLMRYVAERGYPVPAIHDVRAGGTEIVMERIDGPNMMDAMLRRPWTMRRHVETLVDLHDRLHAIAAPEWLRQLDDGGDRVVHLDLHPLNVLLSARGPVVIDWANAARGDPLSDVAATYVLLTCPRVPVPRPVGRLLAPLRLLLARAFVRTHHGAAFDAHLAAAAEAKALDPNMAPDEVDACRRLAKRARHRARTAGAAEPPAGPGCTALVCAMPMELKPLVRKLGLERTRVGDITLHSGTIAGRNVVAVVTGMGTRLAREAVERLLEAVPVDRVVVVGITGALENGTPIGTLVRPERVVDAATGAEHRPSDGGDARAHGTMWTSDVLLTDREVLADLRARGVVALDMETAAIAAACEARGIPWSVHRAISDRAGDGSIDDEVFHLSHQDGTPDPRAVLRYFARHPGRIPRMARLARGARLATEVAAEAAIRACSTPVTR
jgi:nucleoside phosphorylase/aminoglycoside phosphotransferase (APT) family kinase protein